MEEILRKLTDNNNKNAYEFAKQLGAESSKSDKVCGANFDSWWGPVPDNGDVIYRDCPSCGGKKTAWWVHVREI